MDIVNNLQDFITLIDEKYTGHWYYRGESKDYGETKNLASGYRWMKENDKVFMDLLNLRKEFFREVGSKLSDREVENFLAYSQHHGLPTELLDITANPLIALFFACESNNEDDGYLNFFDNSIFDANMTDFDSRQFQYSSYRDLTQRLFSKDISQQKIWFRWSPHIDDDMIQKDIMEQENQNVYEIFHGSEMFSIQHDNEIAWQKYYKENTKFAELNQEVPKLISDYHNSEGTIDDRLDRQIESLISLSFELTNLTSGKYFPKLRYLLIKPTIIFDRMKNQQGSFIYQLTTSRGIDKGYVQPIIPAEIVRVPFRSKQKILKQLDLIGINKKFLYSDDDSTAEYLKDNYKESFYKRMHPFG